MALGIEREVDHHDRVLLDNSNQEDDPDQPNHIERIAEQPEHEQSADAGRGKRKGNS